MKEEIKNLEGEELLMELALRRDIAQNEVDRLANISDMAVNGLPITGYFLEFSYDNGTSWTDVEFDICGKVFMDSCDDYWEEAWNHVLKDGPCEFNGIGHSDSWNDRWNVPFSRFTIDSPLHIKGPIWGGVSKDDDDNEFIWRVTKLHFHATISDEFIRVMLECRDGNVCFDQEEGGIEWKVK